MKRNVKSRVFAVVIGLLFLAGCAAFVSNIVFGGKGVVGELLASWWTLFLIIPGFMGLFQMGTRLSGLWLLIVGVGLLVRSQGWFDHILADVTWWQMGLAALLFVIGLGIIGTALGYTFGEFLTNTGVIAGICLVFVVFYFLLVFKKDLKSAEHVDASALPNPSEAITDKTGFIISTISLLSSSSITRKGS